MHIEQVKLFTAKLNETRHFYEHTLGLKVVEEDETSFAVQLGSTCLTLAASEPGTEPFYHLAMMIPNNLFQQAKVWARERLQLTRLDGDQDEVFFQNWNAYSMYFDDPAGNILELIGHPDLRHNVDGPFSARQLLWICEVGIVTDDVLALVERLREEHGLECWREPSEWFSPVGDRYGLLIAVKQGRIWFASDRPAQRFPLELTIRDIGPLRFG
ncbi:VOC family protein [Paenibacillus massiliensis]|uniref:VOC family protein n=1 Tax=Paenibacillus massiliensis TaxID=225917 RepID=UPI0003F9484E|nr:VOC family protein [Paenibacillus massiliensis]